MNMKIEMKRLVGVNPLNVLKIYHSRDVWHESYGTIAKKLKLKESTIRKVIVNDGIEVVQRIANLKYKQKMSYSKVAQRCNLSEDRVKETLSVYKEKFL